MLDLAYHNVNCRVLDAYESTNHNDPKNQVCVSCNVYDFSLWRMDIGCGDLCEGTIYYLANSILANNTFYKSVGCCF